MQGEDTGYGKKGLQGFIFILICLVLFDLITTIHTCDALEINETLKHLSREMNEIF